MANLASLILEVLPSCLSGHLRPLSPGSSFFMVYCVPQGPALVLVQPHGFTNPQSHVSICLQTKLESLAIHFSGASEPSIQLSTHTSTQLLRSTIVAVVFDYLHAFTPPSSVMGLFFPVRQPCQVAETPAPHHSQGPGPSSQGPAPLPECPLHRKCLVQ